MPMTGPAGASCKRQRPVRLKVPDKKKSCSEMKPGDCVCVYRHIYHIIICSDPEQSMFSYVFTFLSFFLPFFGVVISCLRFRKPGN